MRGNVYGDLRFMGCCYEDVLCNITCWICAGQMKSEH